MAEFNGWTNWETWCVNLWLDNDQGTQSEVSEIVANATNRYVAADRVKEFTNECVFGFGDEVPATLATDLVSGALSEVNWEEIVDGVRGGQETPWDSEEVLD